MPLPYGRQFFLRSICVRKKTKNINPEVDKQGKCFGEILKGSLTLNK